MQEQDRLKIVGIITAIANVFDKSLDEITIKAYLEDLGGYNPNIVNRAATLCRQELRYMPRPFEILTRINRLEGEDETKRSRNEQIKRLPEPDPTDDDRAFGSFVCEAFNGWKRSGFIEQQRKAGTFIDHDHSLFAYMAEQKMDQGYIDRLADKYPRDPRGSEAEGRG